MLKKAKKIIMKRDRFSLIKNSGGYLRHIDIK